MNFGHLLGLPFADLFAGANLKTEVLRRPLGSKRLRYTMAERLRLLDIHKKLGKHLHGGLDWITSPQALAKVLCLLCH